jgi:acetylglutamate kinase
MITYSTCRNVEETQKKASILIEALPYIRQYNGKRVVIKVGGELIEHEDQARNLAEDLVFLKSVGIQVVLCHGGGPQISRAMKTLGKDPMFVNGQRVTDAETLEVTLMVLLGLLNQQLVAKLNRHGPQAVGLSGVDGQMLLVKQRSPELGFVGDIVNVSPTPIERLLADGYIPVIASIGIDDTGQAYNVNADIAAAQIARQIGAEKLILLTNVEGLYESFGDKGSLISSIELNDLEAMQDSSSLSAGMIPKVEAILLAMRGGVQKAHILDGRVTHAVLLEIFTPEGIGTMIMPG